jgi:thiol:disulfide interchange protein
MENISSKDISNFLNKNEWVVLFINADWCRYCKVVKDRLPEIIKETSDIPILGIDARDPDNTELLKGIDFETLPYFAVFHAKKEDANIEKPMSCFIGGDTGNQDTLIQILGMVKQFSDKQVECA